MEKCFCFLKNNFISSNFYIVRLRSILQEINYQILISNFQRLKKQKSPWPDLKEYVKKEMSTHVAVSTVNISRCWRDRYGQMELFAAKQSVVCIVF